MGGRGNGYNSRATGDLELECAIGGHLWTYNKRGRGRLPVTCPDHAKEYRKQKYVENQIAKKGKTYTARPGNPTPEDHRRQFFQYVYSITILPPPEKFDMAAFPLAEAECRHGSLPQDRKIDCDCWKDYK